MRGELYRSDITSLLPEMPARPAFGVSSLVSVFLVDLVMEIDPDALKKHLPVLLHTAFMQMDHHTSLICDQMRMLLLNMIHSIMANESSENKVRI